jgi:hypothetical protein
MLKHPQELGFTLGLKLFIDQPASIIHTPDASIRDVVYVALFGEDRTLEKGSALKIGQTKGTALNRWRSIASLFTRNNLRGNEIQDRKKLQDVTQGREVVVWVRPAGKTSIPYAHGLTNHEFSTRSAEEEFLDEYYEPKLGTALSRWPKVLSG